MSFGQLRVAVHVRGQETPQRYAELQAAVDAHCPVLDLFTNPTTVRTALTVVRLPEAAILGSPGKDGEGRTA